MHKHRLPILIIDNEPNDVQELINVLEEAKLAMFIKKEEKQDFLFNPCKNPPPKVDYASHPETALEIMKGYKIEGYRPAAIITDVHLDCESGGDTVDGDTFLHLIRGNPVYAITGDESDLEVSLGDLERVRDFKGLGDYAGRFNELVDTFLQENFADWQEYRDFISWLNKPSFPTTVVFCGHPREANLRGLEDIYVVQKQSNSIKRGRSTCEAEIVRYLIGSNILSAEEANAAIENNARLRANANPNDRAFKKGKS